MRREYEPEAARLRREGKLWPENLSDEEFEQELLGVDPKTNPISFRMLHDEAKRRNRKALDKA